MLFKMRILKRILFVYHVSAVGGGSYCLLNLLKAIDRTAFEPVVLLPQRGPLCDEIGKLGIEIVYYPPLVLYPYNHSLWSVKTFRTLMRVEHCQKGFADVLKHVTPDIVYMNTMMLFPYLRTAKEQGCKTVLHVREHWPLNEHKRQLNRARMLVYKYADKLIAINRYSASIFPKKEATIVYDWIDMNSRYKPMPMSDIFGEDIQNKKVFLFTGGMDYIKGGIHVAKVFINYLNNPNYRLLMLGVDSEIRYDGIFGVIRRLLASIGIEMRSDQLKKIVKKDSRIVCCPRIYELSHIVQQSYCVLSFFTIPHANLGLAESLILGTPVIAAKTEESVEYSMNVIPELLFSINDEESFVNSINQLLFNYTIFKNRIDSNKGRISVLFENKSNEERINKILFELYKS